MGGLRGRQGTTRRHRREREKGGWSRREKIGKGGERLR